jgi:hypothetical protein
MDPVVTAVVVAVVPLVLAGLSRAGALAIVKPGELRYSRALRWFASLMALLPPLGVCALLLFVNKPTSPGDRLAFVGLLVFFPALAAPLVLEFVRVRHTYDDAGVSIRSPWSKHREFSWTDVSSLRWRKIAKWFDIKTHQGVTFHVSPWLAGLQRFADVALARIPSAVVAAHPEGRAVLMLMSAGRANDLMTEQLPPEQLLAQRGAPAKAAPRL